MSDQTQNDPFVGFVPFQALSALQIPDAEQLYDTLMSAIEPELTRGQVGLLKQRYANELPTEAKSRAQRYQQAFAEYDKALAAYVNELQGKTASLRHQALATTEHEERKKEGGILDDIQTQISTMD